MRAYQFIISITSVPDRLNNELIKTLEHLKDLDIKIIVSIPSTYRKGWYYRIKDLDIISKIKNVEVNLVETDWGPATKLLGGIKYAQKNSMDLIAIITLDDDIIFENPKAILLNLVLNHTTRPNEIITSRGLKLSHPPYSSGNGLNGVENEYCHGVAGFMGVLYPYNSINSRVTFDLFDQLDPDFYMDDDAYFAAVASKLKIPVWSTPHVTKYQSISKTSVVADKLTNIARIERESKLYNELIDKKIITLH